MQTRTHDRRQCDEANDRFLGPILRECPTCVVESVDCDGPLHGFEEALASGAAVPLYTVSARGIRLALVGPPGGAKTSCEAIAKQIVLTGAPIGVLRFPDGRPRAPAPAPINRFPRGPIEGRIWPRKSISNNSRENAMHTIHRAIGWALIAFCGALAGVAHAGGDFDSVTGNVVVISPAGSRRRRGAVRRHPSPAAWSAPATARRR